MCFIIAFIDFIAFIYTLPFHQVGNFILFAAQNFGNKEPFSVA